jgi:hypothetical protein
VFRLFLAIVNVQMRYNIFTLNQKAKTLRGLNLRPVSKNLRSHAAPPRSPQPHLSLAPYVDEAILFSSHTMRQHLSASSSQLKQDEERVFLWQKKDQLQVQVQTDETT